MNRSCVTEYVDGNPSRIAKPRFLPDAQVSLPICTDQSSRGGHCTACGEADNHGAPLTANYLNLRQKPLTLIAVAPYFDLDLTGLLLAEWFRKALSTTLLQLALG